MKAQILNTRQQPIQPHPERKTFDPDKRYRYTWPGQEPKIVGGAALTQLCKGADHNLLAIEEVVEEPTPTEPEAVGHVDVEPEAAPAVHLEEASDVAAQEHAT